MHSNTKAWYKWLLHPGVIFSSIAIGVLLGKFLPQVAFKIAFIGNIYLSLLQMCIIPLIVTAITTSFAKLMHSKVESHLIRRMIMIFLCSLLLASFVGVLLSWLSDVGGNLTSNSQNHIGSLLLQSNQTIHQMRSQPSGLINNFFSQNIFSAFAKGRNIPILIFSILSGLALGFVTSKSGKQALAVFDGFFQTFLTLVNGIMYLLPFGLIALIADQIAKTGFEMLAVAGQLILYTYLIGFVLIVFFIFLMARRTKIGFVKTIYHLREMLLVAFVSGSSFAALPFGIATLIKDFKLSQTKVNLFFPLSVCLNPVGTAYFLALVTVFIGHLYGQNFAIHELLLIWLLAVITAVAIGAIPAVAGFSLLGMLFTPLGLPASTAIVLLIAISNILDPIVTMVNVLADAAATTFLSKPEQGIKEQIHELL